jgi:biopolymer transport protein ExbB
MASLYAEIAKFDDFLNSGGPVLIAIMFITFVMWVAISERLIYLKSGHVEELKRVVDEWQARQDKTSWYAVQIRRLLVAEVALKLRRSISLIKTCIAICPLLGLLGTVTGMISVFEVMSLLGGGSPRAMAEGVSRATIPTMAGMVAAISGMYFSAWLERETEAEVRKTEDLLIHTE